MSEPLDAESDALAEAMQLEEIALAQVHLSCVS